MIDLVSEMPIVEEPNHPSTSPPLEQPFKSPFPEAIDATRGEHETDEIEPLKHPARLIVFIDGANLFHAASQMGIEIDYAKLLRHFQQNNTLIHAFFYTGVDPSNTRQQGFLMWMQRNGFRVVTKEVVLTSAGTRRVGSMNVEIAVDMMRFAAECDTEIIISGDGDLAYAIDAVTYLGLEVEVVALRAMTSEQLINSCNRYIDLASIKDAIQKAPRN